MVPSFLPCATFLGSLDYLECFFVTQIHGVLMRAGVGAAGGTNPRHKRAVSPWLQPATSVPRLITRKRGEKLLVGGWARYDL